MPIKMVVGLGNPGKKYEGTRHNIGRQIVESLKDAPLDRPIEWVVTESFMNESGIEVAEKARYKRISAEDILIVTDEFQIPLKQVKINKGGSDGGHNGLRSVLDCLGTLEVPRMRIGIGPLVPVGGDPANFVLERFSREDQRQLDQLIPKLEDAVLAVITQGLDAAMNKVNGIWLV